MIFYTFSHYYFRKRARRQLNSENSNNSRNPRDSQNSDLLEKVVCSEPQSVQNSPMFSMASSDFICNSKYRTEKNDPTNSEGLSKFFVKHAFLHTDSYVFEG